MMVSDDISNGSTASTYISDVEITPFPWSQINRQHFALFHGHLQFLLASSVHRKRGPGSAFALILGLSFSLPCRLVGDVLFARLPGSQCSLRQALERSQCLV